MPRPPIKATERLAYAKRLGELRAEIAAHKKKPYGESLREHIGKIIDRIDPLETAAVIAGTLIIHDTITGTEALLNKFANIKKPSATQLVYFALGNPFFAVLTEVVGIPVPKSEGAPIQLNDIMIWAVSFVVAYATIKNAGKIGSTLLDLPAFLGVLGIV